MPFAPNRGSLVFIMKMIRDYKWPIPTVISILGVRPIVCLNMYSIKERMMYGEVVFQGLLPVTVLWDYREFRRDEVQGIGFPLAGVHYLGLERITNFINGRGVDSLELCIIHDKALLTDGNHRIVAAKRLGHKIIPVTIRVLKGDGSDLFYPHTLAYFKLISDELKQILIEIFVKEDYQHPSFIMEK